SGALKIGRHSTVMGTLGILRALRFHWQDQLHPLYCAQQRQNAIAIPARANEVRGPMGRPMQLYRVIFLIVVLTTGALCAVVGFFGLLFLIWVALFMWPVLVAMPTSSIIAAEREARTWDILLTTPFDWRDIVLAKVAARL